MPTRIEKGMYWDRALRLNEGCTYVSLGCDHCWSCTQAHMRSHQKNPKIQAQYGGVTTPEGKWNSHIKLLEQNLELPLRVKKPTRWAIWNDLFHEDVPLQFMSKAFDVIQQCPQHTFLLLTKRPHRMGVFVSAWIGGYHHKNPLRGSFCRKVMPNLWLGVTAENQEMANKRIPILLNVPAAVRFVSVEPMLGPVNLKNYLSKYFCVACGWKGNNSHIEWLGSAERCTQFHFCPKCSTKIFQEEGWGRSIKYPGIDWVICGGESGPGARPMHPDWVRLIRDQCNKANVPFFFKGWGGYAPVYPKYEDADALKKDSYTYKMGGVNGYGSTKTEILLGNCGTEFGETEYIRPNPRDRFGCGHRNTVYLNQTNSKNNPWWMAKVGKKAAGRLLNDRTWDEVP